MNKKDEYTLAELVIKGGIYRRIKGAVKREIVSNLIEVLEAETLSSDKRDTLIKAVLEREALISTGVENGIALPHPRTLLLSEGEQPFIAIAFPEKPVNWGTPDNKPVHTLFLIVSGSPKQHLNALAKINYMCMDKKFYDLLASQADKEQIIAAIEEAEKQWEKN